MTVMRKVTALLAEEGLAGKIRVIIGGAPVSAEYAREIGGNGFAGFLKTVEMTYRILRHRVLPAGHLVKGGGFAKRRDLSQISHRGFDDSGVGLVDNLRVVLAADIAA